jgi:hypothetical protein
MTKTWHLLGKRNVGHDVGNHKAMNFVQWNSKAPRMPLSKHHGVHKIWPNNNKTTNAHEILLDLKLELKNVETNSSNRLFLFLPNPKTINLVQC